MSRSITEEQVEALKVAKSMFALAVPKPSTEGGRKLLESAFAAFDCLSSLPLDAESIIKELPLGEITITKPREGLNANGWGIITKEKAHYSPTLTEALLNYRNTLTKSKR